ncbi:MAG: hypothetical protein IKA05_08875 [Clostridia bacterium]|nr:hypothetical protein [Clostridia bacterium]
MKKTLISILLIVAMFFVGCQSVMNQNDVENNSDEQMTSNSDMDIEDPHEIKRFEVRNLETLNEMRDMLSCNDETRLEQYIQGIAKSGVQSKEDLFSFIKIIDSMPQIPILDGNIVWICFSHGISRDTGKVTTVVYVSTEAANGDWTRVEYVLSVADVSQRLSDEKELIGKGSVLNSPVKNSDGNLTVHMETRNPHPSGNGTMIQWVGEVDGIFTRIFYFTNNTGDVEVENLFHNIQTFKTLK